MDFAGIIIVSYFIKESLPILFVLFIKMLFQRIQNIYQGLRVIFYKLITPNKVLIDIVNDYSPDIFVVVEHMEQHGAATNKRLYIGYILKIIEISWQQSFQLL